MPFLPAVTDVFMFMEMVAVATVVAIALAIPPGRWPRFRALERELARLARRPYFSILLVALLALAASAALRPFWASPCLALTTSSATCWPPTPSPPAG